MNGYTEVGYIAAVGSLSIYGVSLLRREQLSKRRLARYGIKVGAPKTAVPVPTTEDVAATHDEAAQS